MDFLLKLFPRKKLWEFVLKQEGFDRVESQETTTVWHEAFAKSPGLRDWLKKRSMTILQTIALSDKNADFGRGQLAENYMYLSFDIPSDAPKVELKEEATKRLSLSEFLTKWNGNKKQVREETGPKGGKESIQGSK